jgi:hypothetical protein
MFDFDIMMYFGTCLLIDLFDDSRPCAFVSGAGLEHVEPLQVHFHVETCSNIQLTVTAQTQYISVMITLLTSVDKKHRLRPGFVVLAPGYSNETKDSCIFRKQDKRSSLRHVSRLPRLVRRLIMRVC